MKTKEFIKKVKVLGFVVRETERSIIVSATILDAPIITVRTDELYQIDSRRDHSGVDKKALDYLFNYTVEYASTLLEEREEEKKYHVKVKNPILKEGLNEFELYFINYRAPDDYFLSDELEDNEYKTQFTQKEIDNFPDDVKEMLPLCKQIEVTP